MEKAHKLSIECTEYNVESQHKVAMEFGFTDSIVRLSQSKQCFRTADKLLKYLYCQEKELEKEVEKLEEEKKEKEDRIKRDIAQSLREETERLYRDKLCGVCVKNPRTIIALPCSHLCLCVKCEACCRYCPLKHCKMLITDVISTFFV